MTATAIIIATLASAALGVGVWLVMVGAVIAATGGDVADDSDRRRYRWFGLAMAAIGLVLFVTGTIVGLGTLA